VSVVQCHIGAAMAAVASSSTVSSASLSVELQPSGQVLSMLRAAKPFLVGSVAGMCATTMIQPVDMLKLRIQVAASAGHATSPLVICRNMLAKEGASGFYVGLSAALYRQCLYCGARMGLYDEFIRMAQDRNRRKAVPFWQISMCSLAAGGLGALVANPLDVVLVRMQADASLPKAERRNYGSIGRALVSIAKTEGLAGAAAGAGPTMSRAMAITLACLPAIRKSRASWKPTLSAAKAAA